MSNGIQVGIIGCGVIAPTHIESYRQIDGVEVVWACDTKAKAAAKCASKYSIARTTQDYRDMLADPDVDLVSVCTDHASHQQIVCDAFAAGKHVLCEKALAISNEQLDAMLSGHAAHSELVFSGVYQHRFDGVNRVAREVVQAGTLGTMLHASMSLNCWRAPAYYSDDWHGTWAREGGSVLINQAIHFLDAMVWVMDGVADISAVYSNRAHGDSIETEDTLAAALMFQNGALGTVKVTSASHIGWDHVLTFTGTKGQITLTGDDTAEVQMKDAQLQSELETRFAEASNNQGVDSGRDYYGTGHPAQIKDVIAAIRNKRLPYVTGESASHTVRVVLGAYESQRTGQRIAITESPVSAVV